MRPRRILAAALLAAALPGGAWAGVSAANFRREGLTGHADVTYTNDSEAVLSSVKVECVPPGVTDRRRHLNLYFSNHLGGGLPPGYAETRSVSFPLPDETARPEDLSCEAHELPVVKP